MYELEFLPIEKTGEIGSKSGDAIIVRFTESATGVDRTIVIDGGYSHTGENVVAQIDRWYQTNRIDLLISTHPDQDHINGIATIMDEAEVTELWMHIPHNHAENAKEYNNIEVVDAIVALAEEKSVSVVEPFTGLSRYGGQVLILGPTQDYYTELVAQHLDEVATGLAAERITASAPQGRFMEKMYNVFERAVASLPLETLGEDGDSGPRNNSSAITLLTVDSGDRLLLTGDAGIPSMNFAWDEYENRFGSFDEAPLRLFQAPHHGSRRNLSPSLLNRIFGEPAEKTHSCTSFISSAKNDLKHPSPKVTNALKRRGLSVFATESRHLMEKSDDVPSRPGYGPATPVGPLAEDDD